MSRKEGEMIKCQVTGKEVKDGLWSMKPFKAPGPNGMHADFYQRNWNVVEDMVVRVVCSIFNTGVMPSHVN